MPTYITLHDDPPLIHIQINLKRTDKFRTYQYDGNLFVKILEKARKNTNSPQIEALGILFVVRNSYEFSLEGLEETHGVKIHRSEISTTADCGKGLLELQLPYTPDEG